LTKDNQHKNYKIFVIEADKTTSDKTKISYPW